MYRSTLPTKLIISKEVHQKLLDFLARKSSNLSEEEIVQKNKKRLEVLYNV